MPDQVDGFEEEDNVYNSRKFITRGESNLSVNWTHIQKDHWCFSSQLESTFKNIWDRVYGHFLICAVQRRMRKLISYLLMQPISNRSIIQWRSCCTLEAAYSNYLST